MAKIFPPKVKKAQETNTAQKYVVVAEASFSQSDWRYKNVNKPFEVYDPRSYGIVVRSSRFIEQQIYDSSGNIIQSNFVGEITFAIRRVLHYYNKIVTDINIEALRPVTILQGIEIAMEGGVGNRYYILIDAASFDAIPDKGSYILTPMTKRTSIGALAEEYREYFRVTDRTGRGHRARIAEILRTNGVDVLSAQKVDVAEWIYRVNYGVVDPPGKDAKFNAGSEIYLPRTEPDFTKVIVGGQEIELTIGEISDNIDKLVSMMETYRDQIRGSDLVCRSLNMNKQIGLLKEFYPRLESHFRSNDYKITNFFPDMVRIGIDENYFLIYVGLTVTVDGSTAYLNKALPGLAVESPFNDPRTMNLIANLVEISLLNPDFLSWEDFVSRYVFPEAKIESREVIDQLNDLRQSPMSILEQLSNRFDKFPIKSDRTLGEENDILATPKLLTAIATQQAAAFRGTGDAVFQNLGSIATKIGDPADTACSAAETVYSELLNKVDYRGLAAAALECLMEQVPYDCTDIIAVIANLEATTIVDTNNLGTETVGVKGLEGVNTVFKNRMKPENEIFADEALAVAASKDFTRYLDKYGYKLYETLAEENAEKSKGEIYLVALEHVLSIHGIDYDSILQEVCGLLSNPTKLIPDRFTIPTLFFPDNLPTVDIDGGFIASIEKAMLDAVIAIIVNMVNGLISTLLNNCIEASQLADNVLADDANASTNNADLAAAIASNVGDDNFADILADLVNSFPGAPPQTGIDSALTGSTNTEIDDTIGITTTTGDQIATTKIQAIQDFFAVLKSAFSATVNNMQIISLLQELAPDNVVEAVVDILNGNRGPFPYGADLEFSLAADINYGDPHTNVREMFKLIAQYVEIQPIIEDLNVIAGKVGCTDLNDFISQRVPLWCGAVSPENIPGVSTTVLEDNTRTIEDLWCIVLGCPELIPEISDPQCTDIVSATGAVSRDPYSFSHMLAHVVKNLFDPVYMAYDSSALTVPDPYYRDVQHTKTINRTIRADGNISLTFFNFSKLQEEAVELPFSNLGKSLSGDDFFNTVTVMNPEFKRLLATGYIPERGNPDGSFGPYTTAAAKDPAAPAASSDSLPPVVINENVAELAPFSRHILGSIDDSLRLYHGFEVPSGDPTLSFFLSEPINNNDLSQFEQTIMRLDLLKDNKFRLQVGKMSLAKNIPPQQPAPGFSSITVPVPAFTLTADSGIVEDAIYDTEYSGVNVLPEKAKELQAYLENRVPPVEGEASQVKLLAEFMMNIFDNGIRTFEFGNNAGPDGWFYGPIKSFSKNVMLPDITKQMSFGIGKACVESPMLRFTKNNNAPYMALVDWAPIPSEEEAECGYDPHILSIDTMVKRVIEQYEEIIECADPAKQISIGGQGRDGLSALEEATMAGLVMTTLRAYALEQLFRTIFPISAYPCNDILTPIQIRFIVDKVKEKLSEKSKSYYNAFLEQLEGVYAGRMKDFSAFGTIPDVVAAGKELGIEWVYADCARIEYEDGIREEPFVTTPSGEIVLVSKITAAAIREQLSNLPLADDLPGFGGSVSDLFNPRSSVSDTGTDFGSAESPASSLPPGGPGFGTDDRPSASDTGTDFGSARSTTDGRIPPSAEGASGGTVESTGDSTSTSTSRRPPKWETCTIRGAVRGTTIQGYRAYGSDDPCIPGPIPSDTAKAPADDTPAVAIIEASLDPELEASLHIHSCEITPGDLQSGTPAVNGYRVDNGACIYSTYDDARDAYDTSQTSATGTTLPAKFEIVDASSNIPITEEPPGSQGDSGGTVESTGDSTVQFFSAEINDPNNLIDVIAENIANNANTDPCEDINPPPIAIPTTPLEEILDCRIGFLIEEQLYSLLEKFQDLVTIEGEPSYSQKFLEEGVPLLDIYRPGFDTDKAISRFFGVTSAATLGQEKLDRQYEVYLEKFSEWQRAANNIIPAANVLRTVLSAVPGLTFPLDVLSALGFGRIPVAKSISTEVLQEAESFDDNAELFYTSRTILAGQDYYYTNLDFGATLAAWGERIASIFTNAAAGLSSEESSFVGVRWRTPQAVDILASHGQIGDCDDPRYLFSKDSFGLYELDPNPRAPKYSDASINPSCGIINPVAEFFFQPTSSWDELFEYILKDNHPHLQVFSHLVPFPRLNDIIDPPGGSSTIDATGDEREVIILNDGTDGKPPQGQVILERYVKTTHSPSLAFGTPQDNFSGERFNEPPAPPGTTKINLKGEIPSVTQVLSPREVVNTSKRDCVERDDSSVLAKAGKLPNVTLGGEINIATEKIWNIDEFQEYLEEQAGLHELIRQDSFDEVSFGLRMVYVAPPPPLVEIDIDVTPDGTTLQRTTAALRAGHKKIPIGFEDAGGMIFSDSEYIYDPTVVSGSRSYFEYEAFYTKHNQDWVTTSDETTFSQPADKPTFTESDTTNNDERRRERFLHLLPLGSVEIPISEAAGIGTSDLLEKILSIRANSDIQRIYKRNYLEDLTTSLKKSSVYQYLFKYSVPGDAMLTFVSIYANMTNELSDEFFDKTKFELKSLFEVVSNGGDYTFETSGEKKRGGNRGEFARAMANYGTEGNTRNPALFDLATKTPKQIFKGLAEFIDPVIKPASTIVKAGHAGKFLPQTMKYLNPDMTPGGVNDKNFFVTNVILPRGAVPPPVGDFAGEYPTVIRRDVGDMPIVLASGERPPPPILDNNEMVTFRLRDRMTKGSETGNHFFDIYLQRVFFGQYNPVSKSTAQSVYDKYAGSNDIASFEGAKDRDTGEILKPREVAHQNYILAMMKRDLRRMASILFSTYRDDLEVVRLGILKELKNEYNIVLDGGVLPNFSPATFKELRKNTDLEKCNARGIILSILKGERPVDPSNFNTPEGHNLATGQLFVINPETQKMETISKANGGGETIDWIIWGDVGGSITIPSPPNGPKPEPVFPGYPLPLPVTPIAYSSLPSDVVPYSPSPPHTPLGWAYHAITAADNLQNINRDLKAVQREEEGMENKKKLHEKLCIDMERISAEEKKRRGLE